jgi:hypothetical protein
VCSERFCTEVAGQAETGRVFHTVESGRDSDSPQEVLQSLKGLQY